tara:strand:+ start:2452 stop:3711 length:1260 start_codon:yes stop_codon:yes gene_type:complete
MKSKFDKIFFYYLSLLFFFSVIYLFNKHNVGNDSTISEWLINYSGGFTKRGLIGQICIFIANNFNANLRDVILFFQILLIAIYFILLFNFFQNIKINKIIILSIFTPIFILYPVAEIEVLARKEIFIFCILIFYFSLKNILIKNFYKLIFLPIAVLIWEPVIFYLFFFLAIDIFENKFEKLNKKFIINLIYYIPTVLIAFYIALNPMTLQEHDLMSKYLKNNFNEICYMSCALLKSKSSIYDQFYWNYNKYSFEVFLRYSLIILFGFGPLIFLTINSSLKNSKLIFFKNFNNIFYPITIILSPVILLFAMGYDWGRWVNISYVFSIVLYIFLYKEKKIILSSNFLNSKLSNFLNNKKIFVIIVIIFCFGWNPKTVMTGDVASNPLWKIPYNASKIIFGFKNFRILQETPISKWHKKYFE